MTKSRTPKPSDTGMTRRAFVRSITSGALAGVAASGAFEAVKAGVIALDSLLRPEPFVTPQGSTTADTLDWAAELFGDVRHSSALPGKANIDFSGGRIHPDIRRPYEQLVALIQDSGCDVIPAALEDLPEATLDEQLLLVGGPVSNVIARAWQGYVQNPDSGIYEFVGSPVPRRWRFEYALDESTSPRPMRYVEGKRKESWPQAIWDESTGQLAFAKTDASTGLLTEDMLLITLTSNPFSPRGATMLDVSDLHGQGNEAFIHLLAERDRLEVLTDALTRAGIPLGSPFQALYRVHVEHDEDSGATRYRDMSSPQVVAIA